MGWKLREALKQKLAIIHERVEAKKLAKLALAEVRELLAKGEEKELKLGMKEITARVKKRVAARLKVEEETLDKDELEKAMEKQQKHKAKQPIEKRKEESKGEKQGKKKSKKEGKKGENSQKKLKREGKKTQKDKGRVNESVMEKIKKSREGKR